MSFPKHMRMAYGKRVRWSCEVCGRQYKDGWMIEFHHRKPRWAGGQNTFENMEALCLEHHYKAHVALRKKGLDHPRSADLVYRRWQRTQGRTKEWLENQDKVKVQAKLA